MDGVAGFSATVELKGGRAEAADDEVAVSVGRAVDVALGIGAEAGATDDDAVGMGVGVEVHELGFGEGGGDGVVAAGGVFWIPVGDGGAGGDFEGVAFGGELGVSDGLALFGGVGVDYAHPAWGLDASAGYFPVGLGGFLGVDEDGEEEGEGGGKVVGAEVHGVPRGQFDLG